MPESPPIGGGGDYWGCRVSHGSYPADYSYEERALLVARGRILVALRNQARQELGWHVLEVITFHGFDTLHRLAHRIASPLSLRWYVHRW